MRLGQRGEDRGGSWGRGCKEEGRRTKRTGELLMRVSRLALSTNAHTHTLKVHTGIYTEHGYCYTLHQLYLLLVPLPPATTHNLSLNLACLSSCLFTSTCPFSSVTSSPLCLTLFTSSLPSTQSAVQLKKKTLLLTVPFLLWKLQNTQSKRCIII